MNKQADSQTPHHPHWMARAYERLAEENEGRACAAIRDDACREVPGNFFRILTANALTNIGDRLASAKTTLPWLLSHLGAPAWCLSLLVPIRESGSMLPQMIIGMVVRRQAIRKWVWVVGSVIQGMSLIAMGWVAATLDKLAAGLAILLLLVLFSLARGACSVAYKDVLGKTIPKTRRGRLSGWISSIAGLGALLTGLGMGLLPDDPDAAQNNAVGIYIALLLVAAVIWFLAAWAYSRVIEFPGETDGGANGLERALARFTLLRDDKPFRRFVIGRALAMGSALAAPFYVVLAREDLGGATFFLGILIAAEGLAGLVSSPIWGRIADVSSRRVFTVACTLAACLSLIVAIYAGLTNATAAAIWFYPLMFLGLGIAHAGIRLGRQTYLIDLAEGNQRTDYVAVSNTMMGGLLLIVGMISALIALYSIVATLIFIGLAGLAGAAVSLQWREVSGSASS